ncbi:MAG TPA: NifU family protein [Rhodocyclaceae bacterium]|nr:NifU family protein [Rhodocyclaceae bacterium]
MTPDITVTDRAREYLGTLLARHPEPGTQLRIYVINPGTSLAHCGISYAPPDAAGAEDARLRLGAFDLLYRSADAPFLAGTTVDYLPTGSGHKLSLKAPNIKCVQPVDDDAPLAQRITYVLETEVNPSLSQHDGTVMLGEVRDGNVAVLKFGGGCHGCGHADHTLRHFVAKVLKERLPELSDVVDDTDHGHAPHRTAAAPLGAAC